MLTSRQSVWWNLKLLCKHCLRDVYTYVRLPSCRRGRRQYLGCRISSHVTIKCHVFPIIMIYSFVRRNFKLNAKIENVSYWRGFLFRQLLFFILWAFQTIFGWKEVIITADNWKLHNPFHICKQPLLRKRGCSSSDFRSLEAPYHFLYGAKNSWLASDAR